MIKEILLYNYWEHVKREKELSFIYPPQHPIRIEIRKVINELTEKINA